MNFYLIQIFAVVFAFLDAKEEAAWSWPFRNVSDTVFQNKKTESKKAHRFGAMNVLSISIILALVIHFLVAPLFLFWYWLVFDIAYAKSIGQNWFYLGTTSSVDSIIKNGKTKAIICVAAIAVLNIVYVLVINR